MARNTRATGLNNFIWEIGNSTIGAYVDSPILKEFHSSGRTQNGNYITFAELIDIGSFSNFGYLGDEDSNFSSQYNKNLIDFIRSVDNHLKDLNALVSALEDEQSGYIRVTQVTINKSSLTLLKNTDETLIATVKPTNATNKNITWSSSNPSIATVDSNGKVKGIALGTTTIIATSVDGGKFATTRVEIVNELSNYYWYIGAELSTITSNIQTDNTKPGWHKIGTLSGFSLNFSRTNAIEFDVQTQYYVIIPDSLHIYAADGNTIMEGQTFNPINDYSLSGYKAFQYKSAVWDVKGVIIK